MPTLHELGVSSRTSPVHSSAGVHHAQLPQIRNGQQYLISEMRILVSQGEALDHVAQVVEGQAEEQATLPLPAMGASGLLGPLSQTVPPTWQIEEEGGELLAYLDAPFSGGAEVTALRNVVIT